MSDNTSKYNGWSNRETWLASLWLNNDEHSYSVLRQAYKQAESAFAQADWLENSLLDQLQCEFNNACLWTDLVNTAFYKINWLEVIESNKQ